MMVSGSVSIIFIKACTSKRSFRGIFGGYISNSDMIIDYQLYSTRQF